MERRSIQGAAVHHRQASLALGSAQWLRVPSLCSSESPRIVQRSLLRAISKCEPPVIRNGGIHAFFKVALNRSASACNIGTVLARTAARGSKSSLHKSGRSTSPRCFLFLASVTTACKMLMFSRTSKSLNNASQLACSTDQHCKVEIHDVLTCT